MIKRDITETIYEYNSEGVLVKKTVIEKHEEEKAESLTLNNNDWWKHTQITCDNSNSTITTLYNDTDSTNKIPDSVKIINTLNNMQCK